MLLGAALRRLWALVYTYYIVANLQESLGSLYSKQGCRKRGGRSSLGRPTFEDSEQAHAV